MSLTKNLIIIAILAGLTIGFVLLSQATAPKTQTITKTYSYEKFAQ